MGRWRRWGRSPRRRRRSSRGRVLVGSATAHSNNRRVPSRSTRPVRWRACARGSASAERSHHVDQYRPRRRVGQRATHTHPHRSGPWSVGRSGPSMRFRDGVVRACRPVAPPDPARSLRRRPTKRSGSRRRLPAPAHRRSGAVVAEVILHGSLTLDDYLLTSGDDDELASGVGGFPQPVQPPRDQRTDQLACFPHWPRP